MKKLMIVILGTMFILAACGGANANDSASTGGFDAEKAANDYKVCAACHGSDLQGSKGGAGLDRPISGLAKEKVLTAIQEGPGVMPKDMITGEAAENLAEWISKQ
ncbi:cytochrome c [Anaerobacillus alkaliphilus]|uniref:Cytochrome c n=1 Tax=Anaerobacillus alkaliphilus TaxID=1548597 RepID=A0A4V1LGH7_9BACI|nr:cytochrome c [Anaerobacillus alkaliphilus]RXJ01704.1 cytochrome c [Anaerobacillus alkaliphilus]